MNYLTIQNAWYNMFNLLKVFKEREGHCNVPFVCIEGGKNLGIWLDIQRAQKMKGVLDAFRQKQLEDIGLVWDKLSGESDIYYRLLVKFQLREGHSNVPQSHIEDGIKLGDWLKKQRQNKKKRKLEGSHEKKLEDGGVVWDVLKEQWEKNYRFLVKFQQREGHANVPPDHIEDGTKLGIWLYNLRQKERKGKLDLSLKKRLEDKGVVWDVLSDKWEKNYHLLIKFRQREGHSNVPNDHIESCRNLGKWLTYQRQKKKKGKLDGNLEKRLEDAGVVWDVLSKHWAEQWSKQWENKYCLLLKFQQREGNLNVSQCHIEDGIKLGTWLHAQRQKKKKGKLDSGCEKRLDEIGIVWSFA